MNKINLKHTSSDNQSFSSTCGRSGLRVGTSLAGPDRIGATVCKPLNYAVLIDEERRSKRSRDRIPGDILGQRQNDLMTFIKKKKKKVEATAPARHLSVFGDSSFQ